VYAKQTVQPSADTASLATSPGYPIGTRGAEVSGMRMLGQRNSTAKGKESRMTLKARRNETLELHANSIKPRTEDTSSNHAPSHEEIRCRAYEIYLERDGLGGNELDDWLQAEAELIVTGVYIAHVVDNIERKKSNRRL
jgi:DUF2934 family protein